MAMTNAELQAAWRARRKAELERLRELERQIELKEEVPLRNSRRSKDEPDVKELREEIEELKADIRALQKELAHERGITGRMDPSLRNDSLARAIIEQFADGEWHFLHDMVKHLGRPEKEITAVLGAMRRGAYNCYCTSSAARDSRQYRILSGSGKKLDYEIVMKELWPLLKGLYAEGNKSMATFSPGQVSHLTHVLERTLAELAQVPLRNETAQP